MHDRRTEPSLLACYLVILGTWTMTQIGLAMTVAAPVFQGILSDPDAYMRLVRVIALQEGGWYQTVIERSNWPYGDPLHWTRPLDLILLALSRLLAFLPFSGDELFLAGVMVSPLIGLLFCAAMFWAVLPLLGRDRSVLSGIALAIQPAVLSYSMAGRADHHSLQFLLVLLSIGATIRLTTQPCSTRFGLPTGIFFAAAIWSGVELLLPIGACVAALTLGWAWRQTPHTETCLATATALLLAVAGIILCERPPSTFLTAEYDKISIVHLTGASILFGFWLVAMFAQTRRPLHGREPWLLVAGAATVGAASMAALYPAFFSSPFGHLDPRIVPIWHERVSELKPLLPTSADNFGRFLFFLGPAVPGLIALPWAAWRRRRSKEAVAWALLAVLIGVYFALALQHQRFSSFAEILGAIGIGLVAGHLIDWSERALAGLPQKAARFSGTFALLFGALLVAAVALAKNADVEAKAAYPECRLSSILDVLNDPQGLGAEPRAIAAMLDRGPEILYRTRHAVIGAPYHRNGDGIWDSYRIFAVPDPAESRRIVERRGIDLLLLCPSKAEQQFFTQEGEDTFYERLLADDPPAWLEAIALPTETNDGFKLYRTVR